MHCKSCDKIMKDHEVNIDDELCLDCLKVVYESVNELEQEDTKRSDG